MNVCQQTVVFAGLKKKKKAAKIQLKFKLKLWKIIKYILCEHEIFFFYSRIDPESAFLRQICLLTVFRKKKTWCHREKNLYFADIQWYYILPVYLSNTMEHILVSKPLRCARFNILERIFCSAMQFYYLKSTISNYWVIKLESYSKDFLYAMSCHIKIFKNY